MVINYFRSRRYTREDGSRVFMCSKWTLLKLRVARRIFPWRGFAGLVGSMAMKAWIIFKIYGQVMVSPEVKR